MTTQPAEPGAGRFPLLFSELKVGNVVLKNRIVSPGHDTVMAEHGRVSDQLVAYQEARAAGGVGLIVVQASGVHSSARYTAHVLMADDDSCIPGYRKLAAAVRPHGCCLFGQLFHPGKEVMESQDGSTPVALAPSAVPSERFHVMPRALSLELIEEIVTAYGAAARRLREAGLDGVEVVASHGYLPAQFLNPSANLRSDAYGGPLENRTRFLGEVVAAVRKEVGDDFVVGVRVSADELEDAGLSAADSLAACAALDAEHQVDYWSVTLGTSATLAGSDHIVPPMTERVAYGAPYVAEVKRLVGVPVFAAGRVNQPQDAERLLADGSADAVIMNRALICDPTMPNLAREGRLEDIRACIACNQACIGHFHLGYPISCIQHPETGRERRYGKRDRAERRRRVLVAGGGPAGLKAAAVAAERGHDVTLYEATRYIGGQVLLAQALPDREEFGGAVTNLLREAERAGARLVTGRAVDRDLVAEERPDVVVVATGARPYRPPIEVMGTPSVLDAWEVIEGADPPPGRIVVADWRADWVGSGVARILAERKHRVVLAVDGYYACERLQQYVRDAHLAALAREKIEVVPLVRLFGVDDDSVYFQHVLTKEPVIIEEVAGLVLAEGHEPVDDLLRELSSLSAASEGVPAPEVIGVGDCLAPRTVEEAVLEGLEAAARI